MPQEEVFCIKRMGAVILLDIIMQIGATILEIVDLKQVLRFGGNSVAWRRKNTHLPILVLKSSTKLWFMLAVK